jgi:hypothetical protein
MIFQGWPVIAVETERRRLEVLKYLRAVPEYEAAAMILREQCRAVGVPSTSDQIITCLHWLAEQELVTLRAAPSEPIAHLTPHGLETARGLRVHPGVMRPDP